MKNRKIATLIIGTVIAVTGVEAIGGSISSVKAMEEREKKIPPSLTAKENQKLVSHWYM